MQTYKSVPFLQIMTESSNHFTRKEKENENEEKQWDFYNKWISSSLSKKIVIIEIAEGFNNPNVIRWPFEKITMINDKARMYRVNSTFYQVPKEIAEKAAAIKTDEMDFLKELVGGC